MARTITDEQIKLSIIINGNPAQKQLLDLEKSTRKLTEENKSLIIEKKNLEKQGQKESVQYTLLTAKIKMNSEAIINNKASMKELQNQIGITGLTIAQLNQKALMLRVTLKNLVPGSEDYKRYKSELGLVTDRLDELRGKSISANSSISTLANGFNKYQALALSFVAGLTGIVFSIQKIIDINGKLSDAQANVMKTTGMTKKEVDELGKSFGLLETRTSRIDLYKIAEQGGRLGIPKAEIQDFIKTMNMAAVSLGDSFTGGVDEVAEKLGKIKFLFKETKDLGVEEAYNSIGSAINDLGANGTASEANIAEFTKRIGSLTDVLKPTVQETLALGTAFEESGIEAETSSRAYNIFMKQASTESSKFAKIMGISKTAVEDMINTSPMNFMLDFAKGMRGMNATETAKTLDYLGVNADGANKVIGAMGNNFERFHELIDLSNNSFANGSSLINEYNIKNETLGATLEKISKRISSAFSSEGFINWLASLATGFAKLIGATEDTDDSLYVLRNTLSFLVKTILVLTAALVTNVGWQRLVALTTRQADQASRLYALGVKARAVTEALGTIATQAYSAMTMLLSGNIKGATQAIRIMANVMKSTPWGFALSAIVAIGTAIYMFKNNADNAADSLKKLTSQTKLASDINAEFNKNFAKDSSELKSRIEPLVSILNNQNVSLFTRKQAYEQLISIAPAFQGTVNSEFLATDKLKSVYDDLLVSMREKMKFQAMQKIFQSQYDEEAKALEKLMKAESKHNAEKDKYNKTQKLIASSPTGARATTFLRDDLTNAETELDKAQRVYGTAQANISIIEKYRMKQIESLTMQQHKYLLGTKEWLKLQSQIDILTGTKLKSPEEVAAKSSFHIPGDKEDAKKAKKDPNKTQAEIDKERLDDQNRFNEQYIKNARQLEDDRIAAMEDGYEKELLLENKRYQREIDDLEKQKVHTDEMAKLQVAIDKEEKNKGADRDEKYLTFLYGQKTIWAERNQKLDDQINRIQKGKLAGHNIKLGIIEENGANDRLKKQDEAFKRDKVIRETNFAKQLSEITSLEEAKLLLKDTLTAKELSRVRSLEEAKKLLQEKFNGEQVTREVDYLNSLLAKLDQIINAKQFEGINLELLTPEQKDHFLKQIEEAKKLSEELKKALKGESNNASETDPEKEKRNQESKTTFEGLNGGADILGFTPDQWQSAYDNIDTFWGKMTAGTMAIMAIQNAWKQYNSFLEQSENAQLKKNEKSNNIKKTRLKKLLDNGIINQAQYNRGVETLDKEYDKKKLDIEYKQAKRKKAMDIVNTIINTAVAIVQGYSQLGPIGGTIAAVLIGAVGALQIATISKQPLPAKGYEKGLYPDYVKRQQDGKNFKINQRVPMGSGLYSKPTIMVGEGAGDGPELVVDKKAFTQISPSVRDAFINELRGVKGFEQGFYNNKLQRYETPSAPSSSSNNNSDKIMTMVMAVIQENTATMQNIKDFGIPGYFSEKDYDSLRKIRTGIKTIDDLKTKQKR